MIVPVPVILMKYHFKITAQSSNANYGLGFMTWYSLSLKQDGDGLVEDAWQLAWEVARSANQLDYSNAIFRKACPGRAEVTLYFTPAAGLLAASFGAKHCEKPLGQGM